MTPEKFRREEWKKMHNQPVKQRLIYFWDYYKWYVISAVAIIVVVAVYIGGLMSEADENVYGLMLNNSNILNQQENEQLAQEMIAEFPQSIGRTEKELALILNVSRTYDPDSGYYANYDTLQIMLNYSVGGMLDFVTADETSMIDFAYAGYFQNLEYHLSQQELQQYAGQLLYVDMAVVREVNESIEVERSDYPDPRKPEEMEDPVPVLIDVSASDKIQQLYGEGEKVFYAFGSNDSKGYAHEFLNYLLGCE